MRQRHWVQRINSRAIAVVLFVAVASSACEHAATDAAVQPAPASPSPTQTPITERRHQVSSEDGDPGPVGAPPSDSTAREAWIDRFNHQVHSGVQSAARWFDGFFGDPRAMEASYQTYGSLSLRLHWTEYEGFEEELRGRGEVELPNLDRRWRAFIGRVDEEDYLAAATDDPTISEQLRRRDDDEEILLGLGFSPLDAGRRRFHLGGGVRIDWPPEPYVRGRYRTYFEIGRQRVLRLRQTAFWRLDEGFGVSSSIDLEQRVDDQMVVRLAGRGTFSESSDGIDWWSSATLYQALSSDHALAWSVWMNGETDDPVPLEEYGVRVLSRRRVYRQWLFLETGFEISWPRQMTGEDREPSWGLIVGMEMQVGLHGGSSPPS